MRLSAFILLFFLTSSLSATFSREARRAEDVSVCKTHPTTLKDSSASYECTDNLGEAAVQTTTSARNSARTLRKLQEGRLRNINELPDGHNALCSPQQQHRYIAHAGNLLSDAHVSEVVCICPKFVVLRI